MTWRVGGHILVFHYRSHTTGPPGVMESWLLYDCFSDVSGEGLLDLHAQLPGREALWVTRLAARVVVLGQGVCRPWHSEKVRRSRRGLGRQNPLV